MDKKSVSSFIKKWDVIEKADKASNKKISAAGKIQKLINIHRLGMSLGWTKRSKKMENEIVEVRKTWNKLVERML